MELLGNAFIAIKEYEFKFRFLIYEMFYRNYE